METQPILRTKQLDYSLSNEEIAFKKLQDGKNSIADTEIKQLLHRCLKMMGKGYNALLPHLNIKLSQAVKLHWTMNKVLKNEFSSLAIFNQIANYEPKQHKSKRRIKYEQNEQQDVVILDKWRHKLEYANKVITCVGNKPLLVAGAIGSGKHSFIQALINTYYPDTKMVIIHLDEQTDVKNLIGTYYVSESDIIYKKGPLTIAAEKGWWILLKNVDKSSDIINGIHIDDGYLHVLSGQKIKCKPSFRILATAFQGLASQDCEIINLEPLNKVDISQICRQKYANVFTSEGLSEKVLASIDTLAQSDLNRHLLDKKAIYSHDIIRVLKRVNSILERMEVKDNTFLSSKVVSAILHEIYDTFIAYIYSREVRQACLKMIIEANWEGIDSHELTETIINQNSKYSFAPEDKSFFFGRSVELPIANNFFRGFVVNSFVNVIEQIVVGVTMKETLLLVGETGTGKTTIVQNIANVIGKKLHVFNMSQNTDSTDLMGGFKPIDTKFLLKPLYVDFLNLFNALLDQQQNKDFLKILVNAYNKNKSTEFFKCVEHGMKSIESKLKKIQKKNTSRPTLQEELHNFEKLKGDFNETKNKIKKADKSFIFKFIEGKLVQSIKNGDWILLDEVNLAPEDVLNKVISIIDKTVLITEKADVENIQIHPEFRMFCCMNPHHSSAGKKALNPILRSKMTEIFVDELYQTKDILPIVEINLPSLFETGFINRITNFYLEVKENIRSLKIHYGTKKPSIGLRNLVRALKYVDSALSNKEVTFAPVRALYEALILNFTTQVDDESKKLIIKMIEQIVFENKPPNKDNMESLKFASSTNKDGYVVFQNYAIKKGKFDPIKKLGAEVDWEDKFIMTSTFKKLVKTFASIICCTNYAILIEGPTSAGKTSTIEYLAKKTHNKCIRINNHEHTDIEEYIGSYIPDSKGKLTFQEGLLVEAVRHGYWVILDELNLAPSEVLEALNRLLDDNNELFIVETQEVVKAHPKFRLFATQNPTEGYGGRKELSEAFKNRFIILHADEIPHTELSTIVHKRCAIAESHAKKLVAIMKDLQYYRQESSVFRGNDSVITVRDLLKWASRYTVTLDDIAHEGYILMAERMRDNVDREFVKKIIEKHCKLIIDIDTYYSKYFDEHLSGLFDLDDEKLIAEIGMKSVIITKTLKKLAVLVHKCLINKEPVLLVGETGCGKTTICQLLALYMQRKLFSINVHQNTETSDFLGCMRTKRDKISNIEALNKEVLKMIEALSASTEEVKAIESKINDPETALKISMKDYSKILKTFKQLNHDLKDESVNAMLDQANALLVNIKSIFEWQDGVLINAMKDGGILLIDEISLANDSVLERLNSVFETERTLILAEKASTSVIKIVGADGFGIVSTMNPSGDFGKKELSPALRNRMTEIWVESYFDQKELHDYAAYLRINNISELKSNLVMKESDLFVIIKEKLVDESVSEKLFKVIVYYNFLLVVQYNLTRKKLSIRDVLNFIDFYNKSQDIEGAKRFKEAIKLVIVDGIGIDVLNDKQEILNKIDKFVNSMYQDIEMTDDEELLVSYDETKFGITPYFLENKRDNMIIENFSFEATKHNVVKILRGLRLGKPILLEGPPGVGKTSTVENIAKAIGKKMIRINLSEHTDMMDLLGSEYPIPVSSSSDNQSEDITFQW